MAKKTGRPLKFKTSEELQAKVDEYFETDAYEVVGYDEKKKKEIRVYAPTISGLAYFLGVDRRTLVDWSTKDMFSPTIKAARQRVEMNLERRLYGQGVAGVIFNLKNNFGWKDKQPEEVETQTGNTLIIKTNADID